MSWAVNANQAKILKQGPLMKQGSTGLFGKPWKQRTIVLFTATTNATQPSRRVDTCWVAWYKADMNVNDRHAK